MRIAHNPTAGQYQPVYDGWSKVPTPIALWAPPSVGWTIANGVLTAEGEADPLLADTGREGVAATMALELRVVANDDDSLPGLNVTVLDTPGVYQDGSGYTSVDVAPAEGNVTVFGTNADISALNFVDGWVPVLVAAEPWTALAKVAGVVVLSSDGNGAQQPNGGIALKPLNLGAGGQIMVRDVRYFVRDGALS